MRLALFLIMLVPTGLLAQSPSPTPFDLKTLSGKTYKSARIFRVEPDGINYMYAGGMVKIPFADLPETTRKQYDYNPAQAAAFAAQDDAAQDAAWRTSQAQVAAQAREDQAALEGAGRHATDTSLHRKKERAMPAEPVAAVDPNWQGGLKTLAKLRVDQVEASPFTLKGALIELSDIDRVEPKEVSEGVYQLTIYHADRGMEIAPTLGWTLCRSAVGQSPATQDPSRYRSKEKVRGRCCPSKISRPLAPGSIWPM